MRLGVAAFLFGCCITAWADEPREQQQEIRKLTVAQARAALAGDFTTPDVVSLLQASDADYELKRTREIVVVHAEEVEPLAFKALNSKYGVIYRNLRSIDEECQKGLSKDRIRPSFPALESISPDLAKRLGESKDVGVTSTHGTKMPLHLYSLKSIDGKSLRELRRIPLCLCGLKEFDRRQGFDLLFERDENGVLLSRKTQFEEDAKKQLRDKVLGKEHNHRGPLVRTFDPAKVFWIGPGIRLVNERCQHRVITFATPTEHQARLPQPEKPPLRPDPFEPE